MSGFSQYAVHRQDENIIERKIYRVRLYWSQGTKGIVSQATEMSSCSWGSSGFLGRSPPWTCGWVLSGQDAASLLQEGWAILAEQARGPSNPLLTLLTNGMERKVAGQSEGWIESSPGRSWPSCLTADKWILETDGAVCNPNERRQVQWWGKQHLPSLPTDGQASTYGPATGYDFNYLYVKSKLGMVIWV